MIISVVLGDLGFTNILDNLDQGHTEEMQPLFALLSSYLKDLTDIETALAIEEDLNQSQFEQSLPPLILSENTSKYD